MAQQEQVQSLSLDAGIDLSGSQFLFGVLDGSGDIIVAGAGVPAIGVILTNPPVGEAAQVAYAGVAKVKAGAAVAVGVDVMSDAAGKAVLATATNVPLGVALKAAAAVDEVIPVLLTSKSIV